MMYTKTIAAKNDTSAMTVLGASNFNKLTTYEVDSAFDLLKAEVPANRQSEWHSKLNVRRDHNWYGGGLTKGDQVLEAIEKVDDCLSSGAITKLKMLQAPLYTKAVARETKRRRKRVRGDFGNEVDIHEVRQGRMDRAWTRTKFVDRETQGSKNVLILLNASMSVMITPNQSEWRSATLMAINDALVKMGKSVSISLMWSSQGVYRDAQADGELCFHYAPLKTSDSYMSPKHLATYTSAAFIRLLTLSKFYNMAGRKVSGGYGNPVSTYKHLPYPAMKMREAGQHVVVVGQCFNENTAKSVLEKAIAQIENKDATPKDQTREEMLGG